MMRPLTLEEFAQQLRLEGNEFADEILVLSTLERDVAEPHFTLCDDLDYYVPENLKGRPARALEWIGDRSNLLQEIEDELKDAGRDGDVDSVIKEILNESENIETIMRKHGGWTEGDLQDALFALIERAGKPMEYDL